MVLLAPTSEEMVQKREVFGQKQIHFTHRCKRSELSRSTHVSGQREFQPKGVLVVVERKYWICEGCLVSEDMNFVHTVNVLSV